MVVIGLAIGLIIAGLIMAWLAPNAGHPMLVTVVRVSGIVLIVIGLIFLLTPVLIWINAQLHQMIGS